MGFPGHCCVVLSVLCVWGGPGVLGQELRETDALCNEDGCFAVYFQRKTFLASWRSCRERGGNLATVKRPEEAALIRDLFSGLEPRGSRQRLRLWIGLQRQPRQCSASRPLRGFTWITGDQDTLYTNWLREDTPSTCSAPRCVVMTHGGSAHEQRDNFKWLDGSCSLAVDGFLCRYTYKGMCPALADEGGGAPLYTTPFNLLSTLLTHVPFGSVAAVPCPDAAGGDQSVLCMHQEDGGVGWSKSAPLCSDAAQDWCEQNNGGCEHYCLSAEGRFYCECSEGYLLADDGQSCVPADACQGAPCEFECQPAPGRYRCACPEGYLLAPDGRDCLDVDECLQTPCPQECVNTPGSFLCRCGAGFQPGEGGACEDVDECADDPCEHACENTPGSYTCHCHLGFSPAPDDPTHCQDTDECQIPGTCEQMCVNHVGGFECHCEEGHELQPDHYSCRPVPDGLAPAHADPSYSEVTSFLGLPWDQQGPGFPWLDQLPDWVTGATPLDWLTDPPSLKWLPTDLRWFTDAPQEDSPPTPPPDRLTDHDSSDWAVPDWIWPAQPAITPEPDWLEDESTPTPEPDWLEDESTPTPEPDWLEDESTPTPAPDWQEDESTPTPAPDWQEDESTPTPAPDWLEDKTTPTPTPDWLEDDSTPTSAPDWLEDETTPIPTPEWFEDESTAPLTSDWSEIENKPSPSSSTPEGGAWQWLWPSPTPAPPEESVGRGGTVPHGLAPDRASEYEFGVRDSDPASHSDSPPSPDSRLPAADASTPEWYSPPPLPLTPVSEQGGRQRQDRSWLVVALLVPLCVFVVVMVALGIVYCTRCAVRPRSKSITECYRWVTGGKASPTPPAPAANATPKSRV
ncbi:endosialin-like [Megalops cyprinoides]|uniref:endosialin-like n=1 Tax=Megalops cyprinoides TaxID=118141 RepID=UPI001863FD7E|nr:endosialin-like [Megalops cyprinoides]